MSVILKAGGDRNKVVDEKEAKDIISRLQAQRGDDKNGSKILSLDLSCRSWTPQAMDGLLFFLGENVDESIETLHLSDIIASRNTEDGLAVMEALAAKFSNAAKLRCLDLSDNALGDRAMQRLELLLRNKTKLERVTFRNCGLGLQSITIFKNTLGSNNFAIAKHLTDLILDKNMLGVDGAKVAGEILQKCDSLEHFSYAGCRPQRAGSKHICDGLAACTSISLRYLNLDDCTIGDGSEEEDGVDSLCVALRRSSRLRYLNLIGGEMKADGLQKVTEALSEAKAAPTHLILESNEIGPEGAEILAAYIKTNCVRTLAELNLECNELGDDGLAFLLKAFRADWNVLQKLNLNENELEKPSALALATASGDFPNLQLSIQDNDDMPHRQLKKLYKGRIKYGEDSDSDDDDDDDHVSKLTKLMGKIGI